MLAGNHCNIHGGMFSGLQHLLMNETCMHECMHETCMHETCMHETCMHETCMHETCMHETCMHDSLFGYVHYFMISNLKNGSFVKKCKHFCMFSFFRGLCPLFIVFQNRSFCTNIMSIVFIKIYFQTLFRL